MKPPFAAVALSALLAAPALAQPVAMPKQHPYVGEIKVLFCYCGTPSSTNLTPGGGFSETSILQPWQDWYNGRTANQTTAQQMLDAGWSIQSVVPRGATVVDQFYVVFVR